MLRRLLRGLMVVLAMMATVFALSGQWQDPWLWAYGATCVALSIYALSSLDDDLARERFRPPNAGADAMWLRFIRLIAVAHLVLGALDLGRWHLSVVPGWLRLFGLVGMLVSSWFFFRAMAANPFFSSVVRVQHDRGHRVVDSGPYAVIRHPGYAGMIPAMAMSGLALGSWLSVAVALVYSALILRRVFFEDAFLRTHLQGYDAYAQRVRYRLLPGVF